MVTTMRAMVSTSPVKLPSLNTDRDALHTMTDFDDDNDNDDDNNHNDGDDNSNIDNDDHPGSLTSLKTGDDILHETHTDRHHGPGHQKHQCLRHHPLRVTRLADADNEEGQEEPEGGRGGVEHGQVKEDVQGHTQHHQGSGGGQEDPGKHVQQRQDEGEGEGGVGADQVLQALSTREQQC